MSAEYKELYITKVFYALPLTPVSTPVGVTEI